jgi:glycerol-3-phosphate cytidylyltransferase-like family protein
MKSILPHFLAVCTAAALAVLGTAETTHQQMLAGEDIMAQEDRLQVPGHNDAVYDAVPKEDQIFKIEFLEIAPTPIIAYDPLFLEVQLNKLIMC